MTWLIWLTAALAVLFGFVVFRGAPYVPSKKRELDEAFKELYPLSDKDVLVDIGSGDGVVLRRAAAHGARTIGYELNPLLVGISRLLCRGNANISIYFADFWRVHLPPETTIVYTFGESRDIARMAAKVATEAERLGKPLFFISYAFSVPGQVPVNRIGAYFLYKYSGIASKK